MKCEREYEGGVELSNVGTEWKTRPWPSQPLVVVGFRCEGEEGKQPEMDEMMMVIRIDDEEIEQLTSCY